MNAPREGARTFVALALGPELGERVARAVAEVLDARAFRLPYAEGLHLTLAFLGDVERARLAGLGSALAGALAGVAAPALRLGGTGAFPSLARARVLWVGVEERATTGRLAACHAAVRVALASAGLAADERFAPHVTVARPRGARARLPEAFAALRFDLAWDPAAVELFESVPGPGGSRYEVRARFPFPPLG